jgi:hypothetical protein
VTFPAFIGVSGRREPVSIITVFNDPEVRRACLDRSIEDQRGKAPEIDYVAVDNTRGRFSSAGAALNHGATKAKHEYLVFAHQDVYLHSLPALEEAAGMIAEDGRIGILGATGVTSEGRFVGRLRDRVVLAGEPAIRPTTVDCVDELLFMIPRCLLNRRALTEDEALAWHAYAVDYGLWARAQGMRVCAVDMPITHNSLTANVDRLDVAYDALVARHPEAMPLVTPQGRIGGGPRLADRISAVPGLGSHRWRYRWLRESIDAHAGRRAAGGSPCVRGDIRIDVDDLLAGLSGEAPLLVVNVDRQSVFADGRGDPLAMTRAGRPIRFISRPPEAVAATIRRLGLGGPVLVTNLQLDDLRRVTSQFSDERRIVGFDSAEYWMVLRVAKAAIPAAWRSRPATPLGMPAPVG